MSLLYRNILIMTDTLISFVTARPVSPVIFNASQQLLELLRHHRFVEVPGLCGTTSDNLRRFEGGRNYFFRKHGQCTVNFLKDGRVHVLYGPIALWNLHDFLSNDELRVLLAFCSLNEEYQDIMRNYMGPLCRKYAEVINQLPPFSVDWKIEFMLAYTRVDI